MLKDLILIICSMFFVYKLITHKGKLSLARIATFGGIAFEGGRICLVISNSLIHIFICFDLLLDTLNLHMLKLELNMI